ncbi:hypothetical protein [Mesorhizobium sp.]|uniref:hypothetical protein n=1 Tax=Mesorhizobium sp. TaxID=1871066 RepID=UPI00344B2552
MEIDDAEVRLLEAVQKNNRLTSEDLAEIVHLFGLPASTKAPAQRRSIEVDVAIVSPKAVGRQITMIALVSLERERADIIDQGYEGIRALHVPLFYGNTILKASRQWWF